MKTTTKVKAYAYPVKLKDHRTGERMEDTIVIPKEWLQICGCDGVNICDDKHMIFRAYNIKGYEVIEIGKRRSIQLSIDLERAYREQAEEIKNIPALDTENGAQEAHISDQT